MANTGQAFPAFSEPIADKSGLITTVFRSFLQSLWTRTGGGPGQDIAAVAAQAAAAQVTANAALAQAALSLKIAANLSDIASTAVSVANLLGVHNGWTAPTGTELKAGYNADASTVASPAYAAADLQAVNDQLVVVQRNLAALIAVLTSAQILRP